MVTCAHLSYSGPTGSSPHCRGSSREGNQNESFTQLNVCPWPLGVVLTEGSDRLREWGSSPSLSLCCQNRAAPPGAEPTRLGLLEKQQEMRLPRQEWHRRGERSTGTEQSQWPAEPPEDCPVGGSGDCVLVGGLQLYSTWCASERESHRTPQKI